MNNSTPDLANSDPPFVYTPGAKILVVMLHAFGWSHRHLADLIKVVEDVFGEGKYDLYSPTLPYSGWSGVFDSTGANELVVNLVGDLDKIWEAKTGEKYERVIFVGHSLGGMILRRVFLAGSLNPPDYTGEKFGERDDLWKKIEETRGDNALPCEWTKCVDRMVLLATWDKGWSISESTAWLYSIGLNVLGAWGRFLDFLSIVPKVGDVIENRPFGRTMLDTRKGAPFIVQTRLLWMAYRRWHNKDLLKEYNEADPLVLLTEPPAGQTINPLVVQVIGSQDDFVSPRDQLDRDVEVAIQLKDAQPTAETLKKRRYFVLKMEETDHAGVADFSNTLERKRGFFRRPVKEPQEVLDKRRDLFAKALQLPAEQLAPLAINPAFFIDRENPVDRSVTDLVFVMHGIRDDGYWTMRIAEAIKRADEEKRRADPKDSNRKPIVACTQTYGYFPMGAFIMPWIRRQKVEWFMDLYVETRALFPRATMHYVGHSNGTYLAASAVKDYPAARFGNIYFAGSVVHPEFDWLGWIDKKRVQKFHNARGGTDWVVALLPKSLEYFTDLGGGGFDGFVTIEKDSENLTQSKRFARGGHSGAITEGHWPEIAKFIVWGKKPFVETDEDDTLFRDQSSLLRILSGARIGIGFLFTLAAILVVFVTSRWIPERYRSWTPGDLFGETAVWVFLATLGVFLAGQYFHWKRPPSEAVAKSLTVAFVGLAGSVALWFVWALVNQALILISVDGQVPTSFAAIGATLTVVAFAALIRFVLTRF